MLDLKITEAEKLLQLVTMVLTDSVDKAGGAPAYLFTETEDNERSVFPKGAILLRGGVASLILVMDDQDATNRGYPGATAWVQRLTHYNVGQESIQTITCEEFLHTYSESLALVSYAMREGLERLIIVAPPFHMVRAFMSVVSAIRKLGADNLRVYNQVGATLPWNEGARHSQGTLEALRREFIVTEVRRIHQYHEKGDLVSIGNVLSYLEWRDRK